MTKDIFDLRDYYSGASKELKMLLVIVIAKVANITLSLIKIKFTRVQIFGKDIEDFKHAKSGIRHICRRSGKPVLQCFHMVVSCKKNQDAYYDYINAPRFQIKRDEGDGIATYGRVHYIYKEEISLNKLTLN